MGRNTRKRRTPLATKVVAGAAALAVGGGGAGLGQLRRLRRTRRIRRTTGRGPPPRRWRRSTVPTWASSSPTCRTGHAGRSTANWPRWTARSPTPTSASPPRGARRRGDSQFVQNAILGPLKDRRKAIIDRIQLEINRAGGQADDNLDELAQCQGQPPEQPQNGDGQNNGDGQDGDGQGDGQNGDGQGQDDGQNQDDNGNGVAGPVADDFIDINDVEPNSRNSQNGLAANGDGGSTGTFTRTAASTRTTCSTATT